MTAKTMLMNQFDLNNNNNKKQHMMAPPSPQLSQDDLVRGLEVLDDHKKKSNSGVYPLSPVSPKHQDLSEEEEEDLVTVQDEYQLENDIAIMIYFEFLALIYWEIPGRSGIVLGGILSSLILTRYYSLLYVFAATLTFVTGFNLIFVNAYNFIRTIWTGLPTHAFPHPYHPHIHNKRYISRDLLNYYIHKSIDISELTTQKIVKIILVQDSKTTALSCLLSALIYSITSLVPTKVFFGLFVLVIFTVPYYYEKHHDRIDGEINLVLEKSKFITNKYGVVVTRNFATLYEYSIELIQQVMKALAAKIATKEAVAGSSITEQQKVVTNIE